PSGYNKDLQEDKHALFDAVDTMLLVVPAVAGTVDEISFEARRMHSALSSTMMATDLADYLVEKGVTFREAHGAVGKLIRESETTGSELHDLPRASFAAAHELFGDDVFDALSPLRSTERRAVEGGTAPSAVRAQIDAAVASLSNGLEGTRGNEL